MSVKASAITAMMALTKDSRNDLIESILLYHGEELCLWLRLMMWFRVAKLIDPGSSQHLVHVKKSTKKTISYKELRTSKPKEAFYYRFMNLADDQLNVFGIMIKNESNGKHVFAHHPQFSVRSKVVISRPKYEGHYEGFALTETDCVYPVVGVQPMLKNIPLLLSNAY